MKAQKKPVKSIDFTQSIDQCLLSLAELSTVQEKSILTANYYKHQETHEKRLAKARKTLSNELNALQDSYDESSFTGKKSAYGQSFIDECQQLQLNLISLACLRFRVGDDPEAFALKDKIHKFLRTLSSFIEALVDYRTHSEKKPNLALLERQLTVLIEAFEIAYPLDHDNEYEFIMDDDEDEDEDLLLLDEETVTLKYDDAFEAIQGFIACGQITLKDLSQMISALANWRE